MRTSGTRFTPTQPAPPFFPSITLPEPRDIVVPPAQVNVQVPEGKPAEVNVYVEKQKGWHFKVNYNRQGRIEEVIATPIG
jgi:hypothetical protein